jgi:hypothetical protein
MKKLLSVLTLLAALIFPAAAAGQEEEAAPNTGALSFEGGIDYTTAYFFRGYLQEDSGLILQPYASISADFIDREGLGLSGYVGIWNSIHTEKTGHVSGPSSWYESDIYGGLDLALGDFTVGTVYTFYTYPNGAFDTIQEIGFTLSYDDSKLGLPVALSPFVGVYFETRDSGGTEDAYGEVGFEPSFPVGDTGITISVPMVLGFSIDDYYFDDDGKNEFLGYGAVALAASVPLGGQGRFGQWTLNASVQYLHLFADSARAANDDDRNEVIGTVGVSFTY